MYMQKERHGLVLFLKTIIFEQDRFKTCFKDCTMEGQEKRALWIKQKMFMQRERHGLVFFLKIIIFQQKLETRVLLPNKQVFGSFLCTKHEQTCKIEAPNFQT